MTFKLLKRRYRSSENVDSLRELEYFNHPYAKGSSIRLLDDLDQENAISVTSLASDIVAFDNNPNKRGKTNATDRKKSGKDKKDSDDDTLFVFEPFDMNKQMYA